jgi:iron(III) transport system ATP-binding protein
MSAVRLHNVSRRFGAAVAVDGIDLDIPENRFVTLLGPSGCGKTTTLRMIAGLEKNDTGVVSIGGRVVSDPAARVFVPPERRDIGMVFQSYAIWPHLTVFENVAYPLRVRKLPSNVVRQKVMAALQLVEMQDFAGRPAPLLSGGQQQRVAIARALSFGSRLLLLDEPLSNLDTRLRLSTGEEFRNLQQRLGMTAVYVTHDQDEAMSLSDRVVVMHQGRILQSGTPEEVYARPASRTVAAFLGAPNLLGCTVASCEQEDEATWLVSVNGAADAASRARSGRPFAAGARVLLAVRPEALTLGELSGDAFRWSGRIVGSVFRGARRVLSVETRSGVLKSEVNAAQAAAVGDRVVLSMRGSDGWIVPEEA